MQIDWYHLLVPEKILCPFSSDLGHFLVSFIWPATWKWLIFEVWFWFWGPIFFQFPECLFTFFGFDLLLKKPSWPCQLVSFSSEFYAVTRYVLEKTVANFNFYDNVFYVPKWWMQVWMREPNFTRDKTQEDSYFMVADNVGCKANFHRNNPKSIFTRWRK